MNNNTKREKRQTKIDQRNIDNKKKYSPILPMAKKHAREFRETLISASKRWFSHEDQNYFRQALDKADLTGIICAAIYAEIELNGHGYKQVNSDSIACVLHHDKDSILSRVFRVVSAEAGLEDSYK